MSLITKFIDCFKLTSDVKDPKRLVSIMSHAQRTCAWAREQIYGQPSRTDETAKKEIIGELPINTGEEPKSL